MAFENLTLFEISLDGAQIGPRTLGRPVESDEPESDVDAASGGSSRGRVAAMAVVALVIAGAALRRRRSGARDEVSSEDAESELAASR